MLIISYYNKKINNSNAISASIQEKILKLSELMKTRMELNRLIVETFKDISRLERLSDGVKK